MLPPESGIIPEDPFSSQFPPDMGAGPPPPLPPPSPPQKNYVPPPPFSKGEREKAFEYVTNFCKASQAYVKAKVPQWQLLEALYNNTIGIKEWRDWDFHTAGLSTSQARKDRTGEDEEDWQSNFIWSPGYMVDSFVDHVYRSIFDGPEWLTVISEQENTNVTQEAQFPAAWKLQQLLLHKLDNAGIHQRIYECLQEATFRGTVYAKVAWYSKTQNKWELVTPPMDPYAPSIEPVMVESEETVYDCPVLQVIPPDKLLPDPKARSNDIQRWRGIGHRVVRQYDDIMESFDKGNYDLNRREFEDKFKDIGSASTESDEIQYDPDTDTGDDNTSKVELWEWHGRIPTKKGMREVCATIATEVGSDSPESGILIRLSPEPVLQSGLRPFVTFQYTPRPRPFGVGLLEREQDIIYQLSQFVCQAQDNARIAANAMYTYDESSAVARWISAGGKLEPGALIPQDPERPNQLMPVQQPNFPESLVDSQITLLSGLLERRTSVTDLSQGVSGRDKTATEASILQQQSISPQFTRADLFARNFLVPFGRIALGMLQQFARGEEQIVIKDAGGSDQVITITEEELRNGKYRAIPTVTRQDHTKIAKAQTLRQALMDAVQLQPILNAEGWRVSIPEMFKRFIETVGLDGADRIVTMISPQEQMLIQQNQQLQMQVQQMSQMMDQGQGQGGGPQGPPQGGPPPQPQGPPPDDLLQNGGPMGEGMDDANAYAQFLQLNNPEFPERPGQGPGIF